MHVDRSRFLVLTATLALAACNKEAETKPDEAKDKAEEPEKKAEEPEKKAEEPKPEEPEKEFGIKGAPADGADNDALPPVVPDPDEGNAPGPQKETLQ
ncbi:hypothetical protein PPSIR1_20829 [Plesiocystis pacifica SIR-1]|uniref:Lipoprotein n=1 Tax=Plesiocystis pacifica SIR-1 TaxID=391625 RepID=A6GGT1_9BACT|nr:hypothetical protein [Plesiocystis pacifica]EDM74928.1 hypothetical protein PPSIR1_20829 [Plesiocystis pacifica SIR-1]